MSKSKDSETLEFLQQIGEVISDTSGDFSGSSVAEAQARAAEAESESTQAQLAAYTSNIGTLALTAFGIVAAAVVGFIFVRRM